MALPPGVEEKAGKVALAFTHRDKVDALFLTSVVSVVRRFGWPTIQAYSGPGVDAVRNRVIQSFLDKHPDKDWLLLCDADVFFGPPQAIRLLQATDPVTCPMVGGLVFMDRTPLAPSIFYYNGEGILESADAYERDALVSCDGTGTGFVLIHKTVFESVGDKFGDGQRPWYAHGLRINGIVHSADLAFSHRVRECGIPIHVDTGCRVGHIKQRLLTENDYLQELAIRPPPLPEGSHTLETSPLNLGARQGDG